MTNRTRRYFLKCTLGAGGTLLAGSALRRAWAEAEAKPGSKMKFGLCTYLWGKDWDLPTLIANCEKAEVPGVELRVDHAHGVKPSMTSAERAEVKKRFDDSPVLNVGMGTNQCYHHTDPAKLQEQIEGTKAYLKLSHDVGGSGVKVKPNDLPKGVPHEKTIEQIGRSLNVVGAFGADHGQQIRLEVHGGCSPLPIIRQIMDVADHPNVGVCWNCNGQDLQGEGLEHNFALVKDRFGATCHVRELDDKNYPYERLVELLVGMDYAGWVLLEARGKPADRAVALGEQRKLFERLRAKGQGA